MAGMLKFPIGPVIEDVRVTTFALEVAEPFTAEEEALIAVVIAIATSVVELPFPTEAVVRFAPLMVNE